MTEPSVVRLACDCV